MSENNIQINLETVIEDQDNQVPNSSVPLWKSLLAEFIGTFSLVFIGASAASLTIQQGGSPLVIGLAFGLIVMIMIYALGSYSGANFNPGVTFALWIVGRMKFWTMILYWIVQFLGALCAAGLIIYFFGTSTGGGSSIGEFTNTAPWKAVLIEAFLTFFFVLTVLAVTRNPALSIISGVAIGLSLGLGVMIGVPWSGGSLNTARSVTNFFSGNASTYWIYIVGPFLGALFAALIYKLITVDFTCCDKVNECGEKILDKCGNPIKECKRPLLNNCGNPISDCDVPKYETYIKKSISS